MITTHSYQKLQYYCYTPDAPATGVRPGRFFHALFGFGAQCVGQSVWQPGELRLAACISSVSDEIRQARFVYFSRERQRRERNAARASLAASGAIKGTTHPSSAPPKVVGLWEKQTNHIVPAV